MNDSQNSTSSKCFSGILRRLLCTGSLPTHPSDLITEPNIATTFEFDHPKKDLKTEVKTPGVVARLMGLDSLPHTNWAPKERNLNSVLRSRSVSSVDYLPEFDLKQAQHRRVRTSVSFREVPTFLQQQQQNHELLFLCFEKVGGSNKMSLSSCSKSEMGLEELKQKEIQRQRNRENLRERKFEKKKKKMENQENKGKACNRKEEPNRVSGNCSSKGDKVNSPRKSKVVVVQRQPRETLKAKSEVKKNLNHKETATESKFRNKKKSRNIAKKVEPICDSENSSPVSVLDMNIILSHHHETTSSGGGDSRVPKISNSRSSSNVVVANHDNPCSNYTRNFIADEHHVDVVKAKKNRDDKLKKKSRESQYYAELLSEILRLTEEGITETHWVAEKVIQFEDVEEICTEFGQQILDLLFHQVVDELVHTM